MNVVKKAGLAGTIGDYEFVVIGDVFTVWRVDGSPIRSGVERITHEIPSWQAWVGKRVRQISVGWGKFPDDAECLYLYDKKDGYFGYAINLDCDWCSEYGTAPFLPVEDPMTLATGTVKKGKKS